MAAGLWFWLIFVMCVLFDFWADWPADRNLRPLRSRLIVFILLGLLGFKVFNGPIQ